MTPERWEQVKDMLQKALELKPEERSAFLAQRCSGDTGLRQEVETLLHSSDEMRSSFLRSSTLQMTLVPGARLGDYEVQSLIGAGGMGEVYRARDLRLRREVALKVLPSFLSSDPERLQRFEREAQLLAALNHPQIATIHHIGRQDGLTYIPIVRDLDLGGALVAVSPANVALGIWQVNEQAVACVTVDKSRYRK